MRTSDAEGDCRAPDGRHEGWHEPRACSCCRACGMCCLACHPLQQGSCPQHSRVFPAGARCWMSRAGGDRTPLLRRGAVPAGLFDRHRTMAADMVGWNPRRNRSSKGESLKEGNPMEERAATPPAKLDASPVGDFPGSPGLFQSLFMRMAEGVALHQITFDRAGRPVSYRFVDVNPQYERFMGVPRERLVGKLAEEVYEDGQPRHLEVFAKVALEGTVARLETYCATLDRHYEVSVAPMGTGFFATILIDVTERRLQERKLLEGEWFLERSQIAGRLGSYRFNAASGTWVSSRGLDNVFGIADDDAVAKDVAGWLSLVHPDDRAEMGRYFAEEVIGKGKLFDRRYRIVRRSDGQIRWMHGRGELEKDSEGRVLYMIGTIQDITESVEQEQALRSKSEELDRIFSLTLDMLCVASADGRFLRVNAAWTRVLGWSVAEPEGTKVITICHPDDMAAARNAMKELASGKDLIDFTNRMRCKDGSYRFIEWRSVPAGGVIYAAARDVSERQRNQAERQRLEQQLLQSQKMDTVGHLAGAVAHDFNDLLKVILCCIDEVQRRLGSHNEVQAL